MKIPAEPQTRFLQMAAQVTDPKTRTVTLAFSSEAPVERVFGTEILDHSTRSVRLGRLNQRAPLLFNHDVDDVIGVVESAHIDGDRKGRATVRFAKTARGEEIMGMVADGILSSVSCLYKIHAVDEDRRTGEVRVTDWEPMEISLVSIPADATVGVGRSARRNQTRIQVMENSHKERTHDADNEDDAPEMSRRLSARQREAQRIKAIETLCQINKLDERHAQHWIQSGASMEKVGLDMLAVVEERSKPRPMHPTELGMQSTAPLGMSAGEFARYDLMKLVRALADPRQYGRHAGLELEVSNALATQYGASPNGLYIPHEAIRVPSHNRRDLTVGTASAGGYLVATNLVGFVDALRNRALCLQLGATMLPGLVGNVTVPKKSATTTAYWLSSEGAAPSESQPTFGQVAMSPKTVGAFTDISRQLLLQSTPEASMLVQNDLVRTIALAIDQAIINGSGSSGQPQGILGTSGIGSVAGGTDGLAPTWAHIVELESDVAASNADFGRTAYLTNSLVRGKLKAVQRAANLGFIWDGPTDADGIGSLNGYRAGVSNAVPSNLVKGSSGAVCSAILFGNFADAVLGMWGPLSINVDDKTFSTTGALRIVVLQSVDVAIRHAESFSVMLDAKTT